MHRFIRAVFYFLIPLLFIILVFKSEWHKLKSEKELPEHIRNELVLMAEKALKSGDVPVGSVVVYKSKILGRGFNTVRRDSLASGHAEVNALNDAMKNMGFRQFMELDRNDLIIYSTYIPCEMCFGTLQHYNIRHVYYMKGHTFMKGIRRELKAFYYSMKLEKTTGGSVQDSIFRLHPEFPGK